MKIVRIFDNEDFLLTVLWDDTSNTHGHEWERLLKEWTDPEFVTNFFISNKTDLKRPHWNNISIENAVDKTIEDAYAFSDLFSNMAEMESEKRVAVFQLLFHPLGGKMISEEYLKKKKAYGLNINSWLRIYALKLGDDMYCITGGAIKLTDNMEEREHTKKELQKLESCKQFLKGKGIIDEDGMAEFLECDDYE